MPPIPHAEQREAPPSSFPWTTLSISALSHRTNELCLWASVLYPVFSPASFRKLCPKVSQNLREVTLWVWECSIFSPYKFNCFFLYAISGYKRFCRNFQRAALSDSTGNLYLFPTRSLYFRHHNSHSSHNASGSNRYRSANTVTQQTQAALVQKPFH